MVLWIGGLMLVGLFGFVFMTIVLVCRAFGACFRAVSVPHPPRVSGGEGQGICADVRCGHANRRGARYCGRCGRALPLHREAIADG